MVQHLVKPILIPSVRLEWVNVDFTALDIFPAVLFTHITVVVKIMSIASLIPGINFFCLRFYGNGKKTPIKAGWDAGFITPRWCV